MRLVLITFIFISCGKNFNSAIYDEKTLENNFAEPISLEPISPLPTDTNRDLDEKPNFFDYSCEQQISFAEYLYYDQLIYKLGGKTINPLMLKYSEGAQGFDRYLKDIGIKNFRSREISRSANPKALKECGLVDLTPPKSCWMRSATLLLLAEKIREGIESPLVIESHFRPTCYNEKIGGASQSDHKIAKALDLVPLNKRKFSTAQRREFVRKVQNFICDELWFDPNLRLSAGFGEMRIHIGIDSPRQRAGLGRVWTYPEYNPKQSLDDPNNPINKYLADGPYKKCFYNKSDISNYIIDRNDLDL